MSIRKVLKVKVGGYEEMKTGRKTLYRDYMMKEAYRLGMLGLTMEEIADFWGISRMTLHRWAKNKPEFSYTLKKAKEEADSKVSDSLYKRALGYQYKEVHRQPEEIIEYEDGQRVSLTKNYDNLVVAKVITKEVIPDTTAQIFWLKNRQPGKWRDKHEWEGKVTNVNYVFNDKNTSLLSTRDRGILNANSNN